MFSVFLNDLLQAEYREKRRRYAARLNGSVQPDLYNLDDYTSLPVVSSSSSADHDGGGALSSPGLGVLVTVSRQDSLSSTGDASGDVRGSVGLTAADDEFPEVRGKEADAWSLKSLPEDRLLEDDDNDSGGRLTVDRKSVSVSVPNLQAWIDNPPVASESPDLVDVQPRLDAAEPDVDVPKTQTVHHDPRVTVDGVESTEQRVKSTATDDVEDSRRQSTSSSSSPQHQRLSSTDRQRLPVTDRRLVDKQLLLNNTSLEAS